MTKTRVLVPAVLIVALVGLFFLKYGDSTGPVSKDDADQLKLGWHDADLELPTTADVLPGVGGAATGLPRDGAYLVNLWASTCGPCKAEMPMLQQLSASGDVEVIGVTRDNELDQALKAMTAASVTYPNVRDEYGDFMESISEALPPQLIPSSFLVVDGVIRWTHLGAFSSYDDLHDSVTKRIEGS